MSSASRSRPLPSGRQYAIALGDQRATVVEVGGGVRSYSVAGRPVLQDYAPDAMCDGAHGTPLVPWPNRLGDGRYRFDGAEYQVPLTEPEKHNAIHGLLRWQSWRAVEHEPDRVRMAVRLHPSPGYPFTLDLDVDYRLSPHGLVVRTTAHNVGAARCPFGSGQHPYLSVGGGLIDDGVLAFSARRALETNDRQLPTGSTQVSGTRFDFAEPRAIGGLQIDGAFTDLARDAGGRAHVRLTGRDGATAALWLDAAYPWLELFTADTLEPRRRRRGLGVEPMTCPPDAFRSGTDLRSLEPGGAVVLTWGACLR